jgi:hypothetical protein
MADDTNAQSDSVGTDIPFDSPSTEYNIDPNTGKKRLVIRPNSVTSNIESVGDSKLQAIKYNRPDVDLTPVDHDPFATTPPNVSAIAKQNDTNPLDIIGSSLNKLFGVGEERFQTWPEKMIRSGLSLPGDVMSGQQPLPSSVDPQTGLTIFPNSVPSDSPEGKEAIGRVQDMAGLAALSGPPMALKGSLGVVGGKPLPEGVKLTPVEGDPFSGASKLSPWWTEEAGAKAFADRQKFDQDIAEKIADSKQAFENSLKQNFPVPNQNTNVLPTISFNSRQDIVNYINTIKNDPNKLDETKSVKGFLKFYDEMYAKPEEIPGQKKQPTESSTQIGDWKQPNQDDLIWQRQQDLANQVRANFDRDKRMMTANIQKQYEDMFGTGEKLPTNYQSREQIVSDANKYKDVPAYKDRYDSINRFLRFYDTAFPHDKIIDEAKPVVAEKSIMDRSRLGELPNAPKHPMMFSDSGTPGAGIAAVAKSNPFYSAVEHAVNNISQPKMNADQWLGTLSNKPGVKLEELEWTGLKDWLGEQKGQVSKEQIQQYLNENKVQVNEVNKQVRTDPMDMSGPDATKYQQYQLPGGTNYREMLLTLPTNKKVTELNNKWKNGQLTENEALERQNLNDQNYKSPHWDEPNILAHVRMNDRIIDGKKSLHIEEIQSDWHQEGREKGYKDPNAKEKFNIISKQLEEARKIVSSKQKEILKASTGYDKYVDLLSLPNKKELQDKFVEAGNKDQNYIDAKAKVAELEQELSKNNPVSQVSDAPFKKTWVDLAIKRIIRKAAEEGYDKISWTSGAANRTNPKVLGQSGAEAEAADRGMREFYDDIVAKKFEKISKQKVGEGEVEGPLHPPNSPLATAKQYPVHTIDLPQSLKDIATQKGFPLFSSGIQLTPVDHHPFVNNSNNVPYGAGASDTDSGYPVNIDKSIPQYNPKLLDKTGKPADLWKYLSIHEIEEHKAMLQGTPYLKAHHNIATPAEKAAVEADGVNWNEYEKIMDGYLKHTEREDYTDTPPNLYEDPYPHQKQLLLDKAKDPSYLNKFALNSLGGHEPETNDEKYLNLIDKYRESGDVEGMLKDPEFNKLSAEQAFKLGGSFMGAAKLGKSWWVPERIQYLKEGLSEGKSYIDISKKLGISDDTVIAKARELGLKSPYAGKSAPEIAAMTRGSSIWTPDKIEQIKNMASRGMSNADIAKELDKTRNAIIGARDRANKNTAIEQPSVNRPISLPKLKFMEKPLEDE